MDNNDPTTVFSNGMLDLLQPIVIQCDASMQAVFKSQNELSDQIDRLAKENFMKVSQNPSPTLLAPVQSLTRSKQRLNNINLTLNAIRDRLDKMEKMAHSDATTTAIIPEVISSLFGKIRPAAQVVTSPTKQPAPDQTPATNTQPMSPQKETVETGTPITQPAAQSQDQVTPEQPKAEDQKPESKEQ